MLTTGPGRAELLAADACWYRVRIKHHQGWYAGPDGRPTYGAAARVHVTPDMVARLPYEDRWRGTQLVDAGCFCLRSKSKGSGDEVDFLARGRRWQLVVGDDTLRSQDAYQMNCHIAVHFYVDLPTSDSARFNDLFDNLPHLLDTVQEGAAGILDREIRAREYREAMYAVPGMLKVLNQRWHDDPRFAAYRDLIHVRFTSMLIRPREEAERRFLRVQQAGLRNVMEDIRRLDLAVERDRSEWRHNWERWVNAQDLALRGLEQGVHATAQKTAKGISEGLTTMSNERLIATVAELFRTSRERLSRNCDAVDAALRQLITLARDLAEQNDWLAEEIERFMRGSGGDSERPGGEGRPARDGE